MATIMNSEALLKRPLYVYDLPPEILSTLQLKVDTDASPDAAVERAEKNIPNEQQGPLPSPDPAAANNSSKLQTCSLCGMTFVNLQDQRSHARSDLHNFNLKRKLRGLNVVDEVEFERLVGDLDESLSGSESSESGSDTDGDNGGTSKSNGTMLSALLKKQANLQNADEEEEVSTKRTRGSGKPPLIWFGCSALPSNTTLGVYRAIFTQAEQQTHSDLVEVLRCRQVASSLPPPPPDSEGGVPLPRANIGPHIFMCMIGGGHFAGMIVSLAPKIGKKQGMDERQATVLAHKTFHRYTTRRKQGGAQSANDAAKGAAHSAGSSLRRYNEVALELEIRELLTEWKALINTAELIFVRATGTTNRRTLFGPYDGQVLRQDDPRNRGFPFSTRRATQAELMRCFVELTRVKVSQVDEAALAAAQAKAIEEAQAQEQASAAKARAAAAAKSVTAKSAEEEAVLLHTTQIEALIRRSKAPALLSYMTTNALSPDFLLQPSDSQAHHHAPTPLHLASSTNSPALVNALLVKGGADPTVTSPEGKTAFEIAGDRATRDAFRLARSELGEAKWHWGDARVPEPLSKRDVEDRAEREKVEEEKAESVRRKAEMDRIQQDERKKDEQRRKGVDDRREKKMGKGKLLATPQLTAEQRREEESRGMTPEMRMRLEREKRARAAEERMRRMAAGAGARP